MYRENDLRLCIITGDEIRSLVSIKLESLAACAAKVECAMPGSGPAHHAWLLERAVGLRDRIDGLKFLRDHVKDGAHDVSFDELSRVLQQLAPLDPAAYDVSGQSALQLHMNSAPMAEKSPTCGLGLW